MGLKELEKLLKKNGKKKNKEVKIDWDAKKSKWLEAVEKFYQDVDAWIGKLPNLTIDYKLHEITEDYIGKYEINKMIIIMLDEQIILEPIGTMLVGAHGRIDLQGKKGSIKFVLVPKNLQKIGIAIQDEKEPQPMLKKADPSKLELVWKIATPAPYVKFIDLDGDVFSDALMAVL
ncbi:MAG: hypothetical protein LBR56_00820 [Sporomusaceae bacterium]|jgi:hypothetical protein|nr:hypothetical protein [Sporomusaceae bacterium]